MYGTIPRSDFLDYYDGLKERKLSLHDMLDEFHGLVVANDEIAIYKTKGLKTTDLSFIIVRAFLGEKSFQKNDAQKLIRSLLGDTVGTADIKDEMTLYNLMCVSDEIGSGIEENFKDSFVISRQLSYQTEQFFPRNQFLKPIRLNWIMINSTAFIFAI